MRGHSVCRAQLWRSMARSSSHNSLGFGTSGLADSCHIPSARWYVGAPLSIESDIVARGAFWLSGTSTTLPENRVQGDHPHNSHVGSLLPFLRGTKAHVSGVERLFWH